MERLRGRFSTGVDGEVRREDPSWWHTCSGCVTMAAVIEPRDRPKCPCPAVVLSVADPSVCGEERAPSCACHGTWHVRQIWWHLRHLVRIQGVDRYALRTVAGREQARSRLQPAWRRSEIYVFRGRLVATAERCRVFDPDICPAAVRSRALVRAPGRGTHPRGVGSDGRGPVGRMGSRVSVPRLIGGFVCPPAGHNAVIGGWIARSGV